MDLPRNLFNADWGTFFWSAGLWQPEGGPYSPKALQRFVTCLADSGVEAFLINPNTQVAWYPTKVIPTALDGYERNHPRWAEWIMKIDPQVNLEMMNRFLDFREAAIDWLETLVTECRNCGIQPWLSIRMNDMHGIEDPSGNPINCGLFGQDKFRLSGRRLNPENPPNEYWRALNYSCPEVRDHYFSMIRDLLERYDVQGLELDFLRNPAIGEPGAPPEFCTAMTEWLGEVRGLALQRAGSSGLACPMGLRIPGSLPVLKAIGLDVQEAVRRGLLDFLGFSNFMQTSWTMPHDELRQELGDQVSHYGVTELVVNGLPGFHPETQQRYDRFTCASAPSLRGNAAGKLVLGVHGIEQFNYYAADQDKEITGSRTKDNMRADYSAIRNVHDLQFLRGQPKHYAFPTMISSCYYPPFDQPEPFPEDLYPDYRRVYRLPMCAEPQAGQLQLVIQVVTKAQEDPPSIGVGFNGSWPNFQATPTTALLFENRPATHHIPEHTAWNYAFEPGMVREGWNEIILYHGDTREVGPQRRITVVGLEVGVLEKYAQE